MVSFEDFNRLCMNSIVKKIIFNEYCTVFTILYITRYFVGVIDINLVGCVAITRTPCTSSITIWRNKGIDLPWIYLPLFFNTMVFGSVIFLTLGTYYVIMKDVIT